MEKINFIFKNDKLKELTRCLKDLYAINSLIKMKVDNEDILFYTKKGKGQNILAFKSFLFKTEDLIEVNQELPNLDFIIHNGKNFYDNLSIMTMGDKTVAGKFEFNEGSKIINIFHISDGKLKFKFITGNYRDIKDISKTEIENRMDPSLALFDFKVNKEDFNELKRIIRLNKSEIINLKSKNNKLSFYDNNWTMDVDTINQDIDDEKWTFDNSHFRSISPEEDLYLYMFDTFILFKENNITLLIGLELSAL